MVRVTHGIGDLAGDMAGVTRKARPAMVKVTMANARSGARVAAGFAKESAGRHGRHYPKSITAELLSVAFGSIVAAYGPDASKKQGGMSFEGGSRNQPAHNDLAKSQDIVGPAFAADVHDIPGRLFW